MASRLAHRRGRASRAVVASTALHAALLFLAVGVGGAEPPETSRRIELAPYVVVPALAETPPPAGPDEARPARPALAEPTDTTPLRSPEVCLESGIPGIVPADLEEDLRLANAALPRRLRRAPAAAPVASTVASRAPSRVPSRIVAAPARPVPVAPTAMPDPAPRVAAPPPPRVRAVPLETNRPPSYPALARRRRWVGVVLLSIRISADGQVAAVEVVASSGHGPLDAAAREAASAWRYRPARRGEKAVETTIRQPVRFAL